MIRAKFRVMTLSRHHNGDCTEVRLLPVTAKSGYSIDDPEASTENAAFWDATPSGECELRFSGSGGPPEQFKLGECVYIDMEPAADARWRLETIGHQATQINIEIHARWDAKPLRSGEVQMRISNEGAWPVFLEAGPGSRWSVAFTAC